MPRVRIDLDRFRDSEIGIFAGRARGKNVRQAARLDQLDGQSEIIVEVAIPEDTIAVTSSFFLGMFERSIMSLGEERFRKKYTFSGVNIRNVIEESVEEALKTQSPLD